jgi:hypothetical protein
MKLPKIPFLGDANFLSAAGEEQRCQRDYSPRKCKTAEEGTPDQSAVLLGSLRLSECHARSKTAITETGIETSVKPIVSPPYDASLLSVDHQSLKPQQIPVNTPRIDALINHPAPSFDKAVASAVTSARRISGVFHTGRSRLG